MDSSATLSFHQKWTEVMDRLEEKHKEDLAFQDDIFEREREDAREANDANLRNLKAALSPGLYQDVILPMAERSLRHELQQIEADHRKRIELIKKLHQEKRDKQKVTYYEAMKVGSADGSPVLTSGTLTGNLPNQLSNQQGAESTGDNNTSLQSQDVSATPGRLRDPVPISQASPLAQLPPVLRRPLSCTVQHEFVNGERRLIMRVQSNKRKTPPFADPNPSKRLRVDTSINPLHTPVATPATESVQLPERTISFSEVYQDGKAKHKDSIVEWPVGSQRWYILKCEDHQLRFTRNPVQGAAKHLNGIHHGFPNRNRDQAIKALGYRVIDCDEESVKLNNQLAELAYEAGYKPPGARSASKIRKDREKQQTSGKKLPKDPPPTPTPTPTLPALPIKLDRKPTLAPTPEKSVDENLQSSRPSSRRKSSDFQDVITDPKPFHIYYAYWRDDSRQKEKDRIYPVMILAWDSQNGSGLDSKYTLNDTSLLKKNSHPPGCYSYDATDATKITGWAPGYEDGGSRVKLRRFPVMFFDENQTTGWISARDLLRFPLYRPNPPQAQDHPFNAARRWIAEREGFRTWEEREQARHDALMLRRPSISPITPTAEPANMNNVDVGRLGPSGLPGDSDTSDASSSGSDGKSNVSSDPDKSLIEEWQRIGGEVTGDEDYAASDSPDTDAEDSEMNDWDHAASSATQPDVDSKRPWAFYGLRGSKNAQEPRVLVNSAQGNDEAMITTGMNSARKLARQACSHEIGADPITSNNKSHEDSPHKVQRLGQSDVSSPSAKDCPEGKQVAQEGPSFLTPNHAPELRDKPHCTSSTDSRESENQPLAARRRSLTAIPFPGSDSPARGTLGSRASSVPQVGRHRSPLPALTNTGRASTSAPEERENIQDTIHARTGLKSAPSTSYGTSTDANKSQVHPEIRSGMEHRRSESAGDPGSTVLGGNIGGAPSSEVMAAADKRSPSVDKQTIVEKKDATSLTKEGADSEPKANVSPETNVTKSILPSGHADFELSVYREGPQTLWEKKNNQEPCVKLFYDAGRSTVTMHGGIADVTIDPKKITTFSRSIIPSRNGSMPLSMLTLNYEAGSLSSELVFDRTDGSKLEVGKIQCFRFIKWLRTVKPDIACI